MNATSHRGGCGATFAVWLALLLPAFQCAQAQTPAAGTSIPNSATADFVDAASTAHSTTSNQVLVTVGVAAGAPALTLTKAALNAAQPGNALAYRLTANNTGATAATAGGTITIDGAAATPVLIRDDLPANTTLRSVPATPAGTQKLFHRAGDAPTSYQSTEPANLAAVDAVGLAITNLPAGGSVAFDFDVTVNPNAALNGSGSLVNTASVSFVATTGAPATVVPSNLVTSSLTATAAAVRNFTAPDRLTIASYARLGSTLYLRTEAAACNASATVIETRTVIITGPNGERETVLATETAANSGTFDIAPLPTLDANVVVEDGVFEARNGASAQVEIQGCGRRIVTEILLVDPYGVVFDSRTNLPVAGARVSLVLASGGVCSTVPATVQRIVNGVILPADSTVVTAADGRYQFELTAPGDYCLLVDPPFGYLFASTVAADQLPAGRAIAFTGATEGGSYGNAFVVGPTTGPLLIDIPVDALAPANLFVRKSASRSVVEIADFLDYTVQVRNNSVTALRDADVLLTDSLPAGFAYEPGSARLDGVGLADPDGGRGPSLTFIVGTLEGGAVKQLSYRVRVGPGAMQGDGTNRARANYGNSVSNLATAKVTVQGGVFSDRGYVVGRVFLDCNRNRVQDAGESGIPGARVFLEDGTSAFADGEGKYSFYGISARTHVLKLDMTTMPAGSRLINLGNRNAGDAGSTFVDLKNGELFKANFAVDCGTAVVSAVNRRRAHAQSETGETARTLAQRMEADAATRPVGDVRAQPSAGVLGETAPVTGFSPLARAPAAPLSLKPVTRMAAPVVDLETLLPTLDDKFGFVGLSDGDTVPVAQSAIRIKGAMGNDFRLSVNGEEVPAARVGKRSVLADRNLQAWEFIGVPLTPGRNELVARQIDQFGNERGKVAIQVMAPDRLAKIEISVPSATVADGHSQARVGIRLVDENGTPVTVRTPLTIEASEGAWATDDADEREPGVQVFVEDGRGEFFLVSPDTPGQARLRVTSGTTEAEAALDFLPDLRPVIATGVVEGVLNLRKLDSRALVPARKQDSFEAELINLSRSENDGKADGGIRAALFLKGKVRGRYLLTLAYDSDKETRQRLFRDIQPDEFYPVYGDSAVRMFDAQSTSKLYVRVDRNKSYLLYGDFTTQSPIEARKLGVYSRSLTGAREHYESGRLVVNAFASNDSTSQVIDEIAANGTSGPYRLSTPNAIENSEKVELLVRDRSQRSIVISTTPLSRFADYEIEPLSGQLILRMPLASLDENLNPQSLRVTYEVDGGGREFWVGGVDAQVKATDNLELGVIAVQDENPQDPATLHGANATFKLGDTLLIGEYVQSDKESIGSGAGTRFEIRHERGNLQAEAFTARTDETFDNPGSYLTQGRAEDGGKLRYRLGAKTLLRAEALRTQDVVNGAIREGMFASVERAFSERLRVELGMRHGEESGAPLNPLVTGTLPNEFTSVKLRVSGQVPKFAQAGVFAEYEQDVEDADRRIAALGGDYQLSKRGRLYVRHEFISSLSGPYALNTSQTQNATVVGLDADYMRDGRLFSEYRVRDAFSGADTEAAIGLRNLWNVSDDVRLSTGFERVHILDGETNNESMAVTLGAEYLGSETWKGTARVEVRDSTNSDTLFATIGMAAKLDADWTWLARNSLAITRNSGLIAGDILQERLQTGLAYRDSENDVWNALAKLEHRYESDETRLDASLKRAVDVISFNANYQPVKALVLTGRVAAKWVDDRSGGLRSRYAAQLVGARATYDLSPHWDLGIIANTLAGGSGKARQDGLGMEVGYLLTGNLWISGGYNVFGFSDDDLAGQDYTNAGAFVRLRFKFDEDLLRGMAGKP